MSGEQTSRRLALVAFFVARPASNYASTDSSPNSSGGPACTCNALALDLPCRSNLPCLSRHRWKVSACSASPLAALERISAASLMIEPPLETTCARVKDMQKRSVPQVIPVAPRLERRGTTLGPGRHRWMGGGKDMGWAAARTCQGPGPGSRTGRKPRATGDFCDTSTRTPQNHRCLNEKRSPTRNIASTARRRSAENGMVFAISRPPAPSQSRYREERTAASLPLSLRWRRASRPLARSPNRCP